ncbi:hypothetical protein D3C80_1169530 [compost metagenome]
MGVFARAERRHAERQRHPPGPQPARVLAPRRRLYPERHRPGANRHGPPARGPRAVGGDPAIRRADRDPAGRLGPGKRLRPDPGRLRRHPLPGHPGLRRPPPRLGRGAAEARPRHRRLGQARPRGAEGQLGRGHGPDPVHARQLPQPGRRSERRRQGRHLGFGRRRPGLGGQTAGSGRLEARPGLGL